MEMLNIVLPMAGKGSRFANAGYLIPKPFIKVCGEPMIKLVVDNLRPKLNHRFIFICQKEHRIKYNADRLLKSIACNSVIIGIDGYTDGQLCTALVAKDVINNGQMLLTANSDQYIDSSIDEFLEKMISNKLDGMIMTMNADNPKWSFVRVDRQTGLVLETAEKKVISNKATVGIYAFRRGADFVDAGEKLIVSNDRTNGEFYICPVYNNLIQNNAKIGTFDVGT